MKFLPILSRSVKIYSCQYRYIGTSGSIFNQDSGGTKGGDNASFESADDFERRIFGGISNDSPSADSFYHKLDRFEKSRRNFGNGFRQSGDSKYKFVDDGGDSFNTTLSDGLDGKLKKAATSFFYEEMRNDDYAFRPDVSFKPGMTYDVKDLDLTRPSFPKPFKRREFEVTTEEALKKADFRNVRFLANFITEAGIIIKRSKTKISAKAQRKIAREIKTSRAFGLMPFTTMGTKRFVFGKTMEDTPDDFLFDHYKFGKLPSEPDIEPLFQKHDEGGDAV